MHIDHNSRHEQISRFDRLYEQYLRMHEETAQSIHDAIGPDAPLRQYFQENDRPIDREEFDGMIMVLNGESLSQIEHFLSPQGRQSRKSHAMDYAKGVMGRLHPRLDREETGNAA